MNTVKRLPPILFALLVSLADVFAADVPLWEANIPPGAETDPIALNFAFGVKEIPNRGSVENLIGAMEIKTHSFSNLVVKASGVGIHKVAVRRDSGKFWFNHEWTQRG
jgi:hypothetical protein